MEIKKIWLQYRDIENENQQKNGCGVCALATVLSFFGKQIDAQTLYNYGNEYGGIVSVGWKHSTLCSLARKYGINAYSQVFEHYSEEYKNIPIEGMQKIKANLEKNIPVIVSLKHLDREGSHLVVVFEYKEGKFAIADPENEIEELIYISENEINDRWNKTAIFFEKI